MSGSQEYLQNEVDPVLAPLIKKLLAERPHGDAAILQAITRLVSEAITRLAPSYPLSPEGFPRLSFRAFLGR
jgi:hypothetical protein